jgi:hypothetical protein
MEFYRWFLIIHQALPGFTKILLTDTVIFKINEKVKLLVFIGVIKHTMNTSREHNIPGVRVHIGILAESITGPFYTEGTETADSDMNSYNA